VAATAALLRQYHPELTAAQVAQRIVATADPAPGREAGYGAGVLNPYRAVTETGTVATGGPRRAGALPAERVDPVRVARREALVVAAVTAALATAVLLLAVIVPRGSRRRWRPG
jgi:subtilisin family serine protease